jgi:hypothetical protein
MNLELVKAYAPSIYFDKNEPFFPVHVGVSELVPGGTSPSFNRTFPWEGKPLQAIIEYAIYWDYDIQHLYELEHIWVYVGQDGQVLDCEASFHGGFFKGLLRDRSNLEDETHVRLYSQPGKHAFMPKPDYFDLLPNLYTCTSEDAGKHGLIITDILKERFETTPEINQLVEDYLQTLAFTPSMIFEKYTIEDHLYITWANLWREIPKRIQDRLRELEEVYG